MVLVAVGDVVVGDSEMSISQMRWRGGCGVDRGRKNVKKEN